VPYCSNCGTAEADGQNFCPTCGAKTHLEPGAVAPLPYFPMDTPPPSRIEDVANFWWRLLSFVIDSVILGVTVAVPLDVADASHTAKALVTVTVTFVYFTAFLGSAKHQTPGMMVVRIHCVSERGRTSLDVGQAALRSAAYCVLVLIGSFYTYMRYVDPTPAQTIEQAHHAVILLTLFFPHYLDLLWAAWDSKRQTLHDKVAHTVVLRLKKDVQAPPGALDTW
jgi:uncharacterized RDD family membrane protein YckC